MSIKQITKLRYKTKEVYRSKDKYYTCVKYDTEFETYPPEEYEYLYP